MILDPLKNSHSIEYLLNESYLGFLKYTSNFLLYKISGFILALQIRVLYNHYHNPRGVILRFGEEAWPSTWRHFMLVVPLAGALQFLINMTLAMFGFRGGEGL